MEFPSYTIAKVAELYDLLLRESSTLRQSSSFAASEKEFIDWLGLPGLNVTSQVIESLALLLSPPLASAQLSFRKRLRKEATDLPELLEFLAVMHSRPLLAWRYSAYSNHDVFVPVQASSILEQSGGNKRRFLSTLRPILVACTKSELALLGRPILTTAVRVAMALPGRCLMNPLVTMWAGTLVL